MTEPIHLLMGDDDARFMESIIAYFEIAHPEFVITTVSSTPDLYIAARDEEPDVILSDYDYGVNRSDDLPNGLAVGQRLRDEGIGIPFAIWSGLSRRDVAAAGFSSWTKDSTVELPDLLKGLIGRA